jgi:hypothetical protein
VLNWVLALIGGAAAAALSYGTAPAREPRLVVPALLRGVALLLLIACVLDAATGARNHLRPIVAIDASVSWTRATDSVSWRAALDTARRASTDTVLLFGDSVRRASDPEAPRDVTSRVRPAVTRARAAGRPLIIVTDGEIDDPDALDVLPGGSRVAVVVPRRSPDVAAQRLDAPRAAVAGDTIDVRVTIMSGPVGLPGGSVEVRAGDRRVAQAAFDSLGASAERSVTARVATAGLEGAVVLRAIVTAPGNGEPRNDTVASVVDVSRAAGAVVVSTSPDYDARYVISVLRGTLALPTRAYFRVAPGVWRVEGALTPVQDSTVRRAVAEAPLVVLHGDTSIFGPAATATRGAVALVAPPAETGEWFAQSAPPSPLSAALSGVVWDSLPPLAVAPLLPAGDWQGLITRRARQFEQRPAVSGSARPRRRVVVGASGLWRWKFRGGVAADAYDALWGSIFDWLVAEGIDPRAAIPSEPSVRAGEPIRWRRGASDSVVRVVLARRDDGAGVDSLTLRFGTGISVTESRPLRAGVYDVQVPGGRAVLVVNPSLELLPHGVSVHSGAVGGATAFGDVPGLRSAWWAYALALTLLCTEWVLRRRLGLR